MSRSRKKSPVYTDYGRNSTWFYKNQANRTVRRYKGVIANGNGYRKVYLSWNIHDWRIWFTAAELERESKEVWVQRLFRK